MSKSSGEKPKHTAADFDLRVRDRNIQNGVLDQKTVDKYLADLVDTGANCDTLDLGQPALDNDDDED